MVPPPGSTMSVMMESAVDRLLAAVTVPSTPVSLIMERPEIIHIFPTRPLNCNRSLYACFCDRLVSRQPPVVVGGGIGLSESARPAHVEVAVEAVESVVALIGRRTLPRPVAVRAGAPLRAHADEVGAEVARPHLQGTVADGAASFWEGWKTEE